MSKVYFKITINDLNDNILEKSTVNNPYKTNRTTDGQYILLSFEENNIPIELFQKQYIPLTASETKAELETADWNPEVSSKLIYEPTDNFPIKVRSFNFTAPINTTSIHDYKIPEDLFLKQVSLLTPDANFGDHIKIEIIDIDNTHGLGENYVLRTPIEKAFIQSTAKGNPLITNETFKGNFIAKDLYIRIHYTNITLLDPVNVYINFLTFKK